MMIAKLKTGSAEEKTFTVWYRTAALLLLSVAVSSVHAADMPDPTRPPSWLIGDGTDFGGAGGGAIATGQAPVKSSGLQSTIISGSRRAAIIDGRTIELWGKYGNAELVEVNEGSVVLRTAKTRRVLTLFPDVKMTQKVVKSGKASPPVGVQSDDAGTSRAARKEKK